VRTDFILSAEIMVISLNEVVDEPFVSRAVILAIVAVAITVVVYGFVGMIVKMDDVGLRLAERPGAAVARLGRGLVKGMPRLLTALTVVGTAAMLWVGGHILLVGTKELGLSALYDAVHHLEEAAHDAVEGVGAARGMAGQHLRQRPDRARGRRGRGGRHDPAVPPARRRAESGTKSH
jgi:predicted DNA repair protein MutK